MMDTLMPSNFFENLTFFQIFANYWSQEIPLCFEHINMQQHKNDKTTARGMAVEIYKFTSELAHETEWMIISSIMASNTSVLHH
jgi:hypothetical protein